MANERPEHEADVETPAELSRREFVTMSVAAGFAVAAAGGGVAAGLAARSAEEEYDALLSKSATEPVAWSDVEEASDRAESRARLANVLYGTAGAAGNSKMSATSTWTCSATISRGSAPGWPSDGMTWGAPSVLKSTRC